MADGPDLSELVRRAIEANTRFYQGWVNLSLEYFRGITEIFGGVQSAVSGTGSGSETGVEASSDAVILEAVEGETASGAFLVTNDLGRTLKCELVASDFSGSGGEAAPAEVTFDPPTFELEPGEQRVVRATVTVDRSLTAGAAYNGSFGIKGMAGFSVPVVLRKQHAVDVSPIDLLDEAMAAADAKAAATRTGEATGRTATASTKKAASKATRETAKKAPAAKAPKKAARKGVKKKAAKKK